MVRLVGLLLALACAGNAQAPWSLVWSDEFDGPRMGRPDPAKWTYDLGASGWGNRELENYTRDNAFMDGEGHLIIEARKTPEGGYTSSRLKTQGIKAFTYGKIEARMQLPVGQGMWPAFWMLGEDVKGKGWPACGEIDIMEHIGKEPGVVHGTIHGPGYSGAKGIGAPATLPPGDFHIYSVIWEPESIEFQVDGRPFKKITPADLPAGTKWVYDHPYFLLLNLAIGGNWPGPPNATTQFPQRLTVDYVRVYARE
jgi:beta-glucanase (GH16 family)